MKLIGLMMLGLAWVGRGMSPASADSIPFGGHSTLTAYVSEQALVQTPSSATFHAASSMQSTAIVSTSIREMALDSPSALRMSVKAHSEPSSMSILDTPPAVLEKLRWNSDSWTNATGHSDTLATDAYTEVATATPLGGSLSTTNLQFYLPGYVRGQLPLAKRLLVSWKVEYLGL